MDEQLLEDRDEVARELGANQQEIKHDLIVSYLQLNVLYRIAHSLEQIVDKLNEVDP